MSNATDYGNTPVQTEYLGTPADTFGLTDYPDVLVEAAALDYPGVGGDRFLYKMRGQDDGRPAPGYISWVATFQDFAGTQVATAEPPLLGTLIPGSVVEVSRWLDVG